MPQRRTNLIYGYISSYYSIIDSLKWIDIIKQSNELAGFCGDIESGNLGVKEDRNNKVVKDEYIWLESEEVKK